MNAGKSLGSFKHSEGGVALLELALVLPMFLLVALVGLEMSRALAYTQNAAALSREAGDRGFRACIGEASRDTEGSREVALQVKACLEMQRMAIETFSRTISQEAEVILSLFRYEGDSSKCQANEMGDVTLVARGDGSQQQSRKFTSAFSFVSDARRGRQLPGGLRTQTICINRAVVVAEVFIPYRAISGGVPRLFSFTPEVFYSAAIF